MINLRKIRVKLVKKMTRTSTSISSKALTDGQTDVQIYYSIEAYWLAESLPNI